jgi:PAS domain S-box-containing protein
LRETEALYRSVIETSPDAITVADLQGRLLFTNRRGAEMHGFSSVEEYLADPRPGHAWIAPHDRVRAVAEMRRVVEEGSIRCIEYELMRRDGTFFPAEVHACLIRDAAGKPIGMLGIARDISDRRRAQEELLRAQRLESLGLVAGGIAHDFNNLLSVILGNISLVLLQCEASVELAEPLRDAEQAVSRARDLTAQLLAFAKGGAPVKRVISLARLVREAAGFAFAGSQVRAELDLAADLWAVAADEGQLSQVFGNVLLNAAQAMSGGGRVAVALDNVTLERAEPPALGPGPYVRIVIRDHGVGIPSDLLPRIFDPYFTTKERGTGLGLTTSYAIVKRHGGHLAVESEVGVGTTVRMWLPAASEPGPDAVDESAPLPRGRGTVLLLDDEDAVRTAGRRLLQELGYDVVAVADGRAAVDLYAEALGQGRRFDAVVLDLTIPGGMGGLETLHRLRELDPAVRAIVASGYSDDSVMAEPQRYGFRGVVPKPFGIRQIGEALRRLLQPG